MSEMRKESLPVCVVPLSTQKLGKLAQRRKPAVHNGKPAAGQSTASPASEEQQIEKARPSRAVGQDEKGGVETPPFRLPAGFSGES
jgi:hypothetical protein